MSGRQVECIGGPRDGERVDWDVAAGVIFQPSAWAWDMPLQHPAYRDEPPSATPVWTHRYRYAGLRLRDGHTVHVWRYEGID